MMNWSRNKISFYQGGTSLKDIKSIRAKTKFLMEAERMFFNQKARCDFLNFGDRCSKFFHDMIKKNNKRNSIIALTKRDENVTTDAGEIGLEFVA